MSWLAACGLTTLHILHSLWTTLVALLYYPFLANPAPLQAHRTKVPKNLTLVLSSTREEPSDEEQDAIVESVASAVRWCRLSGVKGLSVYDRYGFVTKSSNRIKAALEYEVGRKPPDSECSSDGSDMDYPPTPPSTATDFTDSRSLSPENWCPVPCIITIDMESELPLVHRSPFQRKQARSMLSRKQNRKSSLMTLSLVSYEASKPFMASVARSLVAPGKITTRNRTSADLGISVESIDRVVQESLHLPPPDLMLVHSIKQHSLSCPPLELYGFPPWLLKLTEFYYDDRPSLYRAWHNRGNKRNFVPLSEENFRRALDSYARAEMRLGK